MATYRVNPQLLSWLKSLFKIVIPVAIVIVILAKLFGDITVGQTEISLLGSHMDERIENFHQVENAKTMADRPKTNNRNQHGDGVPKSKLHAMWNWADSLNNITDAVFVMIPLAKAKYNLNLQTKFRTCVTSMSQMSSAPIVLFIAGDAESRGIAEDTVNGLAKKNMKLQHLDVDILGEGMKETINMLQQHFSYKPGTYYSHTLFFLSTAIHRLAPPSLHRLIILDADLKFMDDINFLYSYFQKFSSSNVLGIAYENQPVYRHILSMYRQSHPNTRAGEPPPKGLPGFNSGVLLLDLDRMRQSQRYNTLLDSDSVKMLAEKYLYKGHLGDQDFYSLVSLENEDLFYVLPCGWNRQLCQWWKDKGYEEVFDSYYTCRGKISIYHGNCNTPFPDE